MSILTDNNFPFDLNIGAKQILLEKYYLEYFLTVKGELKLFEGWVSNSQISYQAHPKYTPALNKRLIITYNDSKNIDAANWVYWDQMTQVWALFDVGYQI